PAWAMSSRFRSAPRSSGSSPPASSAWLCWSAAGEPCSPSAPTWRSERGQGLTSESSRCEDARLMGVPERTARGGGGWMLRAASQFQAVVNQTNVQIAALAERQAAADSEAEALGYEIQIAEEQLALVTFQLEETRALADSLRSQAAAQTKQLEGREDIYARH